LSSRTRKDYEAYRISPEFRAEDMALRFMLYCEDQRQLKGLSYAEIARRMGVSRARVNKMFKEDYASTFNTLTLVRLADALEIRLSDALDTRLADLPLLREGAPVETAHRGEIVELKVKPARKTASRKVAVSK